MNLYGKPEQYITTFSQIINIFTTDSSLFLGCFQTP